MQTGIPVDIRAGCGRGPAACPGGLPDAAAARAGGLVVHHGRRGVGAWSGALDRFGENWPEMRRKPGTAIGTATGFRAVCRKSGDCTRVCDAGYASRVRRVLKTVKHPWSGGERRV